MEKKTFFVEKMFSLRERGGSVRTEILAGITTFLTMAYIIVVNPAILSRTGMPFQGVLMATVLVCAVSSIAMGLFADLPFALAPGMGINAFFTYTMVKGMGVSWETGLGAVFISGILFLLLTFFRVRTLIVRAVPACLRYAVAAGIGMFLTLIGLESVGFIVPDPSTITGFGGLTPKTMVFFAGFLLTAFFVLKRITGALILGMAGTTLLAFLVSGFGDLPKPLVAAPGALFSLPSPSVFLALDIRSVLAPGMIAPVFALLFTDLFDSISTFLGVAQAADLMDETGQPIHVEKALMVDAFSTTISGLLGTSSGTTFIESAAGVEQGGRTGLTAVVTGLLFLPFMFLSPLLSLIPDVATAPVLVIVGVFMMRPLENLDWKNLEEAIPAFLALVLIPLTYSITQGIVWGFLVFTVMKVMAGKGREVHWMLYVVDAFAVFSLILPML